MVRPNKDAGIHFNPGRLEAALFVLSDPLATEGAATPVAAHGHHALATSSNGKYFFELSRAAGLQEWQPGSSAPRVLPIDTISVDLQQGTSGVLLVNNATVSAEAAAHSYALAATVGAALAVLHSLCAPYLRSTLAFAKNPCSVAGSPNVLAMEVLNQARAANGDGIVRFYDTSTWRWYRAVQGCKQVPTNALLWQRNHGAQGRSARVRAIV